MIFKKFFYKKVNSTNDLAIKKIKTGISQGIIVADYQKKRQRATWKKMVIIQRKFIYNYFF